MKIGNLTLLKLIGKGTMGEVYLSNKKDSKDLLANNNKNLKRRKTNINVLIKNPLLSIIKNQKEKVKEEEKEEKKEEEKEKEKEEEKEEGKEKEELKEKVNEEVKEEEEKKEEKKEEEKEEKKEEEKEEIKIIGEKKENICSQYCDIVKKLISDSETQITCANEIIRDDSFIQLLSNLNHHTPKVKN